MATDRIFKDLRDEISSALVNTTRTAGQISNEDLAFHRSSNSSIVSPLEQQNERLLQLARRMTRTAISSTDVTVPHYSDVESVEDNWKGIVDVVDNLLEKADVCLDEYTGVIRRLSPNQEEQTKKATPLAGKQRPDKAYRTQNIAKPQLLFKEVPTNDELTPFKPLLRSKPHAIMAFEESVELVPSIDGSQQYKHPYEIEVRESQYPAAAYTKADPIPYLPYETSQATLVDTPEAILAMLEELKMADEIAVDLEHHDEHSYIGLVSLMQISTRDKDWIVDTLKPWRQELQVLNEVFADPRILKIFHGAYMDMIWLQRDFGLYVVGLFDTFHASRSLGYARNGLAYLLKRFADFDSAKQYQMADWRIRPLPTAMFNYARSDTHFLLYIYDNMRNELIEKSDTSRADGDLIKAVMEHSKAETLHRYERPLYDIQSGLGAMGWYNMLCRTPALFNREQFAVFRAAHQWRDTIARQEDESVHTIMPKHVLYNIAREAPTDMLSLLGCSHPMSIVFRRKKESLLGVIKQAKTMGAIGPNMRELMQRVQPLYVDRNMNATAEIRTSPALALAAQSLSPKPLSQYEVSARSDDSHFWGPTIASQGHIVPLYYANLRLALPLPQLTAEVFEDPKAVGTAGLATSQTDSGARVEHQYVKARNSTEDVFVVNEAWGFRKRKPSEVYVAPEPDLSIANDHLMDSNDNEADEVGISSSVENVDSRADLERKRLKKARKEARKLEKARRVDGETGAQSNGDAEAFDYANAPSILHAKRNANGPEGAGGSKAEAPYLKSMNAPKGMRKTKKEISGKSFTFKT